MVEKTKHQQRKDGTSDNKMASKIRRKCQMKKLGGWGYKDNDRTKRKDSTKTISLETRWGSQRKVKNKEARKKQKEKLGNICVRVSSQLAKKGEGPGEYLGGV